MSKDAGYITISRDVYDRLRDLVIAYAREDAARSDMEHPIVKELRDQAARETKGADNPFEARKQRIEWRAAAEIERLGFCLTNDGAQAALHAGEKLDAEDFPPVTRGKSPEHCQTCGLTDLEYSHTARICTNPWHADGHLRGKSSRVTRPATTSLQGTENKEAGA